MKRILLIALLLSGCERIEDNSNMLIANCHTGTKQQTIEFELLSYEGEEMTREQGLDLLEETISEETEEVWECK